MERIRRFGLAIAIVSLILAGVLVWQRVIYNERQRFLTVAFLDIGQGDSIYIEGPGGAQVLVDGGPPTGRVLSELGSIMPFGDRSLDALIVTNPDADHYGGFLDVLKKYDVGVVLEPGTHSPNASWSEFEKQIGEKHIKKIIARRGMRLDMGGGVFITVLFPDRDVSNFSHNDGSIIARLEYGSTSVMLTGDTTKIIEEYMVNHYKTDLPSTVLKVAHHGSRTSTSSSFVAAVSPVYAVISCGRNNQYGFPRIETLNTLKEFGVKLFRTDLDHTVVMHSNGKEISFKK